MLREVLGRIGVVAFDSVAMQPGHAQGFGAIGPDRTPFFALSGDPVSAYVSFEVFVRPTLRRMIGVEPVNRPLVRARLHDRVVSNPPAHNSLFARASCRSTKQTHQR